MIGARPVKICLQKCDRAFKLLVCLIYGILTLIAFAQVIVRYFLGGSLPWSEEAIRFLFVWLSFLGFSVTMSRGGHIGVDFLPNLLPPSAKRLLAVASDLLIVGFLVFLLVQGAQVARVTMHNLSPAMHIPMGYVYMIFPISSSILLLYTVRQAFDHWHGKFGRQDQEP